MKKKITSIIVLMVIFILPQQVMATTDKYELSYTCQQQKSNWCYAACSKSTISQYKGMSPTQKSIARYVQYGDEDDSRSPANVGATVAQIKSVLNYWDISCSRKFNSLSLSGLKSQIADDHLIHACFRKGSTSQGHDELVFGWSDTWGDTKIGYMEPSDGDIYWEVWDDFSSGDFLGSSWSWYASIFDCTD